MAGDGCRADIVHYHQALLSPFLTPGRIRTDRYQQDHTETASNRGNLSFSFSYPYTITPIHFLTTVLEALASSLPSFHFGAGFRNVGTRTCNLGTFPLEGGSAGLSPSWPIVGCDLEKFLP